MTSSSDDHTQTMDITMAKSKSQSSDIISKPLYDLCIVKVQRERRLELLTSSSDSGNDTKILAPEETETTNKDSKKHKRKVYKEVDEATQRERVIRRPFVEASFNFGKVPSRFEIVGPLKMFSIYICDFLSYYEPDYIKRIDNKFEFLDRKCSLLQTKGQEDSSLVVVIQIYHAEGDNASNLKISYKKLKGIYKTLPSYSLQNIAHVYALLCHYFVVYNLQKHKPGKAYMYILCAKRYLEHAAVSQWTAAVHHSEAVFYMYMANINSKTRHTCLSKAEESWRLVREHCKGDSDYSHYMRLRYLVLMICVKLDYTPLALFGIILPNHEDASSSHEGISDLEQNIKVVESMLKTAVDEASCLGFVDRESAVKILLLADLVLNMRKTKLTSSTTGSKEKENTRLCLRKICDLYDKGITWEYYMEFKHTSLM